MINFVQWHAALVDDNARVGAYDQAIAATVRPGDVVVDLGTGTGVMSLLACRAGAARVYAIEGGDMVEIVRRIVRANGLEDRIACLYGDSKQVELPERVDVAIADQTGPLGIGGGAFAAFNDARRRFLKPHGKTIPSRIDLSIGLAEYPEGWAPIEFWDEPRLGFDLSAMHDVARNLGYEVHFTAAQLLSDLARVLSFRLAESAAEASSGTATLVARRCGTLHGLFGCFSAELSSGVSISNSPLGPGTIKRRAWYMPIERPVALETGDSVRAMVHLMPVEEMVTWRVEVTSRDGVAKAKSTHSTFKGTLIAKEDLHRMRPDYVPRLSAQGEMRRSILELCDGARSARRIAEEIRQRFAENFQSAADA
ncbi:MAG: 50S ribosomal protein L11 methyltransferase, partial [Candidatus Binataceae bacterium]